jgi:hypothetical protein
VKFGFIVAPFLAVDVAGEFLTLDRLVAVDKAGEFLTLGALFEKAGELLTLLRPLTIESSPSSTDSLPGEDRTRGDDATRWDAVSRLMAGDDWGPLMDVRFGVLEGGGIVAMVSRLELVMEMSAVVSCTDDVEETLLRRERYYIKSA